MKLFHRLFIILLTAGFLASCSEETAQKSEDQQEEFIRVLSKTTETYNEEGTDIETVEYSYTERSDMFWQKAEFKDSEGRIIKLVRREFNEKGLPVLEKTEELGTVVSTVETEYCPHSYYLLEKTVYNG
ncbi:MAG: hypothetical protein ACLFR2_13410, partial [Candidatus Kapaibacterium sp.]